jgi:hypothetical protein
MSSSLAKTPVGRHWGDVVDATMSDRSGMWRLMRGGLAYLVVPALFGLLILMLWARYRRSPRSAVMLGGVALLANLSTQVVKHPPFSLGDAWALLNPLSGHVGVAGGVLLGWLVVTPARNRGRWVLTAFGVIASVGSGVVLAGWHTPFQVVCPLLICTGWAIVGSALMPHPDRPLGPSVPILVTAAVVGLIGSLSVAIVVSSGAISLTPDSAMPVLLALVTIIGMCLLCVTSVVLLSGSGTVATPPATVAKRPVARTS